MIYSRGFLALTSMLIMSAVLLSVSVSVTSRAIFGAEAETGLMARDTARSYAEGCVEYALMELLRSIEYAGNESILVGDGACEILSIEDTGDGSRTLRVESVVGTHAYRLQVVIETVSPTIVISSYAYVANF